MLKQVQHDMNVKQWVSVLPIVWHLHNLSQHTLHILRMHKKYQRPVRANAGLAKHAFTPRLKFRLGGMNIRNLITDVMLSTRRILLQKCSDGRIARKRLNQFNLRSIHRASRAGRIHETDLHTLIWQIKWLVDFGRTHDVTVKDDAVRDG